PRPTACPERHARPSPPRGPYRGKPNEPAYLPLVGAALADARGTDAAAIAELTRANAARVFGVEGGRRARYARCSTSTGCDRAKPSVSTSSLTTTWPRTS